MDIRSMRRLLPILVSISLVLPFSPAAADAPRMTKEELKKKLGNNNVIVIDVRTGHDWESSHVKIKGAVREDPKKPESWAGKYAKERTIILYCS